MISSSGLVVTLLKEKLHLPPMKMTYNGSFPLKVHGIMGKHESFYSDVLINTKQYTMFHTYI